MELYRYTAIDAHGKTQKGTMKGDTAKMIRVQLRAQGMVPVAVDAIDKKIDKKSSKLDRRIRLGQLAIFTRELGSLLHAGLELEESLYSSALNCEDKHLAQMLLAIHAKILEGYSFSHGLDQYPKAFPHVYRASVGAGEEAGFVGDVLINLADYLESQQIMRQKIITIMMYPAILSMVAIGIVFFLLIYVAPKILTIFEQSDAALPWVTQVLMVSSDFLAAHGLLILGGIVVFGVLLKLWLSKSANLAKVQIVLMKIPLLGNLIILVQTGRFLRTLSILARAQVPILKAFSVASELVTVIPIREKIKLAGNQVKEGASIHKALKQTGAFKPTTIQLIASAEASGEIEKMMLHAAENQERQIQFAMDTFLALFEPILILVMGCMVLFIVLAMLLPMFQISQMV